MKSLLFPDMVVEKDSASKTDKALQSEFYQRHLEHIHKEWFGDSRLSSRELFIVRLIAIGRLPKQIADFLNLSPKTISTHLKNIYNKLGIHKQTELVTWYYTRLLNGNVK
jgi:DNA-binding CsgD family transcriptional regulator